MDVSAACSFHTDCNLLCGRWLWAELPIDPSDDGPCFWILRSQRNTGIVTQQLYLKWQVTVLAPYGNENWERSDQSFPCMQGRALRSQKRLALQCLLSAVRSVTENKFLQISRGLDRSGGRDLVFFFWCAFLWFPTKPFVFGRLCPQDLAADRLLALLGPQPLFRNSDPEKSLGFIR